MHRSITSTVWSLAQMSHRFRILYEFTVKLPIILVWIIVVNLTYNDKLKDLGLDYTIKDKNSSFAFTFQKNTCRIYKSQQQVLTNRDAIKSALPLLYPSALKNWVNLSSFFFKRKKLINLWEEHCNLDFQRMTIIPLYKTWVDTDRIKMAHWKVTRTMKKSCKHFLLLFLFK